MEVDSQDGLTAELDLVLAREAHGGNLKAAFTVLADGRARTIGELVADAVAAKLLSAGTNPKVVYVSLLAYLDRVQSGHRVPRIVQEADRRFRINESPDGWPAVPAAPAPVDVAALAQRLRDAGSGLDPAAFEVAVCDAFSALGYNARHIGGKGAPDAVLDAPLGALGYRVMVECKTTQDAAVPNPHVAEAAKFREAFKADYCIMVGPAFPDEDAEFVGELQAHRVSAWSTADLSRLLDLGSDPFECRPLFEQLFAADRLESIGWEREHGRAKRIAYIAATICAEGWNAQRGTAGAPADAPHLTEDAAMLLVDTALRAANAAVVCERADVREAFAYLSSPLVRAAEWLDAERSAVIVRRPRL